MPVHTSNLYTKPGRHDMPTRKPLYMGSGLHVCGSQWVHHGPRTAIMLAGATLMPEQLGSRLSNGLQSAEECCSTSAGASTAFDRHRSCLFATSFAAPLLE